MLLGHDVRFGVYQTLQHGVDKLDMCIKYDGNEMFLAVMWILENNLLVLI